MCFRPKKPQPMQVQVEAKEVYHCKNCYRCRRVIKDLRKLDENKCVSGELFDEYFCSRMDGNIPPEAIKDYGKWLRLNGVPMKDFEVCELFDIYLIL